ncbi:UvrD-helicase domain-containing protein [Thermodesulfobacteriota bacterium]
MATMIPRDVESFSTEGEEKFYRFVEQVARPDSEYICWYLPDLREREPDFILFSRRTGLIVFEVKDWNLEQIMEADAHWFKLRIRGKVERRRNPSRQAREYRNQLMDVLHEDGRLLSRDPEYHGKIKIPIGWGICLPNINKYEYERKDLAEVISADRVFFWDDLHPDSPICSDSTGTCFADALSGRFSPMFRFTLTGNELDHLKHLLFPIVRVNLPERQSDFPYERRMSRLKALDHHQEALARSLGGGHRIVVGPPGSGKTLILVHKAALLLRYDASIRSILIVCYNITLVNYIERLLAGLKAPLGAKGVLVRHFYQLCSEIMGEEVEYEDQSDDYYSVGLQETIERASDFERRFDAIMIDEGQDFSDGMFRVVTSLLKSETNNLTIALDDNQNIYRRRASWKDVGIQARGRVHRLSHAYRTTVELATFASRFVEHSSMQHERSPGQRELFPDFFDFRGPGPEMRQFSDWDNLVDSVVSSLQETMATEKHPCSDIAILYATKFPEDAFQEPLPVVLGEALESRGILSTWVSRDYQSKSTYDVSTNRVAISTIHSVKGTDYACVFVIGLDHLLQERWSEEQMHSLAHAAVTRARYRLSIPFIIKTPLIGKLERCLNPI